MFGFFKKDKASDKPVLVKIDSIDEYVKADCLKIIKIGQREDPNNRDPASFSYDPTGRHSLGFALIDVPHTSGDGRKSGGRPAYIGTDICIEAIVLCVKKVYPSFIVAEDHLVKLGYRYASSRN